MAASGLLDGVQGPFLEWPQPLNLALFLRCATSRTGDPKNFPKPGPSGSGKSIWVMVVLGADQRQLNAIVAAGLNEPRMQRAPSRLQSLVGVVSFIGA